MSQTCCSTRSSGCRPRRWFATSWTHLAGIIGITLLVALGAAAVGPALPAMASSAPTPTIYTATDLSNTAATLNASVDPAGTATTLTFCYSTSAITISGSDCTSSGTVGYATATASPASSSSAVTFSAYVTNLSAGATYYYAAGASQTAGSTSWSSTTTFTTMTGAPFVCTPNFYEEAASYLWGFDAVTQTYVAINSSPQAVDLNPIGYDTLDNYIYGVGGSEVYQIGSDGNETPIGTPTYVAATSGDFIPGTNFLLTENGSGGPFDLIDVVSTSPASAVKPASVVLGATAGSATFGGNDFALTYVASDQDYIGYGLKMSGTGAAVLSKAVVPQSIVYANDNSTLWSSLPSGTIANAITVTAVSGITFPAAYTPASSDAFGSAYSDSSGDVFFLANNDKDLYEATAAQVASGTGFQLSYKASATNLTGGSYDGADCSSASSPFSAPTPVDDTYTVVAGNTLTVNASQGQSLLANDQIITGATVTMGTTTLEPSGADQSTTFGPGDTTGTLTGANGTLDVTNASAGYFTFTPNTGFNGPETFTYNLAETYPYDLTSSVYVTVTINVVQQQVVTWSTPTALSTTQLYTAPNPATDLGAAPISYSVVFGDANTAGCSVNPTSGVITYVGPGQCTLEASAAANSSYSAGSTQLTFTVTSLAIPTLSWTPTPTTLTTAQSGTTIAGTPVTDSDGAVTYAIAGTGDTAGCSLASSTAPVVLDFTTNEPGQCSITVSTAATATYAADSVTVPFSILAIATFAWSPSPTSFTLSQSPQDLSSATTNSDGVITYAVPSTGNSAHCLLASSSAPVDLSFTADGTCTVTASLAASTSYTSAAPVSQLFTVGLIPQTITFTSTAPTDAVVNGTYTPSATGGASGNPVTFAIDASSSAVCSYSGGIVTFNTVGNCVVDANQAGNTTYAAASQAQQTIAVGVVPQTISFTAPASGAVNGSSVLTATATSTLPVVLSVDSATTNGACSLSGDTVDYLAVGSCVIDANQAGNTTYAATPQVQQTIAIGLAPQAITFTSTAPTDAAVNGTYSPSATGGASSNPVTFAIDPSSSAICTYSGGIVTFDAVGSCFIDANQAGNSIYAAAPQAQQTIAIGLAPQAITFSAPTSGSVGGLATLSATGGASGNPVVFTLDGTTGAGVCNVAGINGTTVNYTAVGSCVIDANQAGNSTYAAAPQVQQTIAVGLIPQAISFTSTAPTDAAVNGTYSPSATGGASGNPVAFAIDPSSSAICTYSGDIVTFNTVGNCVVDANQAGNTTYAAASQAQQTIAVGVAPQTISFTAPASGAVNGSAELTATATSALPVTLSVDGATTNGACSLSATTVDYLAVGSCVLDANQAGNSTYAAAPQVQQTIAVGLIPQAITFTSAAPTDPVVNGTYSPSATGGASGNPVTFAIDASPSAVCSYSVGTVTFDAVGSCIIDANQAGNVTYAAASQAQQTIAAGLIPQTISFTAPSSGAVNGSSVLTPTASSGRAVALIVDAATTNNACSLTGDTVDYLVVGSCVIDANQAGNSTYAAAPRIQQTIAVGSADVQDSPPPPVLEVSLTGAPNAVTPGGTYELTIMPALSLTGGQAGDDESLIVDLPAGETFSGAPRATNWLCQLSTGNQALTCAWTGAVPLAPGTSMGDIQMSVHVSPTASGTLAATVRLSDSTDDALPLTVQTSAKVSALPREAASPANPSGAPAGTRPGYRLVGSDGGVFDFGGARFFASCHSRGERCHHLTAEIVGMVGTPDGHGYWLAAKDGGVFAFGDAQYLGSCPASTKPCDDLSAPIAAIAATPNGHGYWLVATNGAVFFFGDAGHFGSCASGSKPCGHLGAPIVGIAVEPDGLGYWLVSAKGAVYAFGRARFHGNIQSSGIAHLRGLIVGMASTRDGKGYWLVGSDGGVFAFGNAHFLGNTYTANVEGQLQGPIVGIAAKPEGSGYWLAGHDGGVFAFSGCGFLGNTYTAKVEDRLVGPVMGMAPSD